MTEPKKRGGRRPGSGRKPGVPNKINRTMREKAAAHGDDALGVLTDIMADSEQDAAVRVKAASVVLDRGYGRPTVHIEAEADIRTIPWDELREISRKGLEEADAKHKELIEGRAERLGLKIDYTSEDED